MSFRQRVKLPDPTVLIILEGDDYDGIEIRARKRVSLREAFRYRRAIQSQEKDEDGSPIYSDATAREWAKSYLMDWNLNNEDDEPIPATADAFVETLPADLTALIIGRWAEAVTGVDPNSEPPSSDGDTSAAQLTDMATS